MIPLGEALMKHLERLEMRERLKREFLADREYREAYAEDFLNTSIAMQIRTIRDQRNLTQSQLAMLIGTKQAGISRVENINYSAWNIGTLKKIATALGVRLKVSFETFGSLIDEAAMFSREELERPSFEDDPVFHGNRELAHAAIAKASSSSRPDPLDSHLTELLKKDMSEQQGLGKLSAQSSPSGRWIPYFLAGGHRTTEKLSAQSSPPRGRESLLSFSQRQQPLLNTTGNRV